MKSNLWIRICLIILLPTILNGSSIVNNNPLKSKPFKVALLVEGTIYDQGWDSQGFEGLRRIERTLNAKVDYVERVNAQNMEEITRRFSEDGYDLIFGHGRVFQQTFNKFGKEYPNVSYVFFNEEAEGDNVFSISFAPESMGFFAGMTAGLMTKTNIVGIIPAYDDQREIDGFIAGVQYVNKAAKVLVEAVGDWGDRIKGRQIALEMIQQEADILFGAGDAFNIEVINAARENRIYAIGFITDQSFIARDTVLVSVLQNVAEVYLQVAKDSQNKTLHDGKQIFDFFNGGQALTDFGGMVPIDKQVKILDALNKYNRGELKIAG